MSENKWTPGPWMWDGNVWDYDKENEAPWLVAEGHSPVITGDLHCSEANADLIAAAPDLYAALEDALQYLQHHLPDEVLAPHRAALAKARGEA